MFALILEGYDYLFFIPFIIAIIIKIYVDNNRKIAKYVADDFKELGYELLSERAYKFSESKIDFKLYTGVKINNIPLERFYYVKEFMRVFTAKAEDGNTYRLFTSIKKEWNWTNTIKINDKQIIES